MPGPALTGNCYKVYKKHPTPPAPQPPWPVAMCTHVIHSPFHSFRGQLEMRKAAPHKALRAK